MKLIRTFAMALAASLLASCAGLIGPRQIEVPLAKMQAGLERRFPVSNRALELLDVELSHPQLALLPDGERIALTLDALVAPPFLRQSWHASLALSGRLYLDNARGAILMADPRVDQFSVDGMDEARQRQMGKLANLLMNKVVRDTPLYSFRMEDLRYAGVQFVPTRIQTTAQALVVTLEPQR
ncbi:MAG: DUF1439 domain-containing protein [Pseudomonadota bacterium]